MRKAASKLQNNEHKHGGKLKKKNYTPTNMEAFHQANDAHVTSGPFLQRNGMSFPTGGYIPVAESTKVNKNINKNPAISAYIPTFQDALRSFNNKMLKDYGVKIKPGSLESVKEQREYFDQGDTSIHYVRTLKNAADTTELLQTELPHAIQLKHYGQNEMLRKSLIEHILYPRHDDTYDIKGTLENEAHYGAFKDSVDEKLNKHLSTLPYKFKGGGTIAPYITKDPNDPRIQAYKDSLTLYNKANYFKNIGDFVQNTNLGIEARYYSDYLDPKRKIQPVGMRAYSGINSSGTPYLTKEFPQFKKPSQKVILQTEQEMPKDTVKVPSTPPTKKLVQTKYMDARPYYQEEQMKDYDKTGKLDSAKIDAHKRWLKEQGTPNRDTNLLPVKHPYGGNISSLGQAQGVQQIEDPTKPSAVQQGIGSFGPWGAAISAVSQTGTKIAGNSSTGQAFTSGVLDPSRTLGALNDKRFNTGEKLLSFAAPFTYGMMKAKKDKRTQAHNDLLTNTEGFQDSGFMANGGLLNIDPQGRVVTSRYDQGGNIRRIQGGVMHDEGYGIEHAYGAPHEQGGMDYTNNAEIQGGEKVLDGEYVITDEPGSQLDKTQMSISRRLDKNTKALSHRNDGEIMKMATDKLKAHAIQQNEEYLTVRNNERDTKLRNAIRRAIKKYGGDLETLDAEMQMKHGGRFMGINPAHKGYCTPMTKSTCTPHRKALARTLKKHHGFHGDGGVLGNRTNLLDEQDGERMFSRSTDPNSNYLDSMYNNLKTDPSNQTSSNSGQGWKNAANTAVDLAPVIANTIAGLSKADKVKASKYYTRYINPELMHKDFDPIRRSIASSQYGLRNSGMYSRAGQASIAAQGAKAMGDYSFNVDQANTGIRNQFKGLNSQIETGNRGIDWQSDMFNFQAKDARRNYLMQAAGDISRYSQNKQNYNRDQEFLEMAYPEYARIMRSKRG